MGGLITALLLLTACVDHASEDRAHYATSVASPPAEGGAPCLSITTPSLRDECLALAAGRASKAGHPEVARAWCETVEAQSWRGECWFQVAEGTGRWDAEVASLCDRAGPYAASCHQHLLFTRAVHDPRLPDTPGQEARLRQALKRAVAQLPEPPVDARRLVDETVAKRVAARLGPEEPLRAQSCGSTSAYVCALVYVESMRTALRSVDREPLCAAPLTSQKLSAVGFRGWTPEVAPLAQEVWAQLCRPGRGASLLLERDGFSALSWPPDPPAPPDPPPAP